MKLSLLVSFYILLNTIIFASSSSRYLEFDYESSTFGINENENNYEVEIRKGTNYCIKAPCNQNVLDKIKITNKEDMDNLKIVFDDILSKENINITTYNDLTSKQKEIIKNVFDRNNIFYTIINDLNQHNKQYDKRGYYYDEDEKQYRTFITIAMGEKPNGGYSIDVAKIEMNEEGVTIYVNENKPEEGAITTSVMTYPVVQIKFNFISNRITIVNNETGEKFPLLEDPFVRISSSFLNAGHFLLILIIFIF